MLLSPLVAGAQRYLTEFDTSLYTLDTLRTVVRRYEHLYITGYIQPQYQFAGSAGIRSYEGGNFTPDSDNRFMLRRARVKFDYIFPSRNSRLPIGLFTFQVDATERGVNVRDMFARVYEPSKHDVSLTMGLFARPYGYEINLSSAFRETPERGRMSQILMPTERDLGAMVSFESQHATKLLRYLKLDVGLFNGQGLAAGAISDFDSYKDLIGRLTVKPVKLGLFRVSGGLSLLHGGWRQATRFKWEMEKAGGVERFILDSSLSNIGDRARRRYQGADVQVSYQHKWGKTELRAEYWRGTQPGTATTTVNPGVLPEEPTYIRPFDGAFLYWIQSLGNPRHELMVKYDWYDPNRRAGAASIGGAGYNLTPADVRYHTLGFGYTHYFNDKVKFLVYHALVRNEATQLGDYKSDVNDDVFTARFQLRF